jgi:hypothetical protein
MRIQKRNPEKKQKKWNKKRKKKPAVPSAVDER